MESVYINVWKDIFMITTQKIVNFVNKMSIYRTIYAKNAQMAVPLVFFLTIWFNVPAALIICFYLTINAIWTVKYDTMNI